MLRIPPQPRFRIGKLVATPHALKALEDAGQNVWHLVSRHLAGDWGEKLSEEDCGLNDRAVKDGSRILSAYSLKTGETIWVITEADRSLTTVLLPEDY